MSVATHSLPHFDWDRLFQGTLTAKQIARFYSATQAPKRWLSDEIIRRRLYQPDQRGAVYMPVAWRTDTPARRHSEGYALSLIDAEGEHDNEPMPFPFFANALRYDDETVVLDRWGQATYFSQIIDEVGITATEVPPLARVVLGDHHIFTFEFDQNSKAFFQKQMSWLAGKNDTQKPIGQLFAACSTFADFAGLTVVYGGNKSLHIHLTFATASLTERLAGSSPPSSSLRDGLVAHWERLRTVVEATLDTMGVVADRSLRLPEAYRRVPNGIRVISGSHLFGAATGTHIPQVVLEEKVRQRAKGNQLQSFFDPTLFRTHAAAKPKANHRAGLRAPSQISPEVTDKVAAYLRAHFGEYPAFAGFQRDGMWLYALFFNNVDDKHPSSRMREDHRTILPMGKGAPSTTKPLLFPLGMLVQMCAISVEREKDGLASDLDLSDAFRHLTAPPVSGAAKGFAQQVRTTSDAGRLLPPLLKQAVSDNDSVLICAPEGIGKTSGLIAHHDDCVSALAARGLSTTSIYAFGDYAAALAKCEDFKALQDNTKFAAVVLPSFQRVYDEACAARNLTAISQAEAARAGYPSRLAAIRARQPKVLRLLEDRHAALWAEIGNRKPVFFCVHQVLHNWGAESLTTNFWSPGFFGSNGSPHGDTIMRLGLAIHDEIRTNNIVEAVPIAVLDAVDELLARAPDAWRGANLSLVDQLRAYNDWAQDHNGTAKITFDEAIRYTRFARDAWEIVVTADTGEYAVKPNSEETSDGNTDVYAARHGKRWAVRTLDWWHRQPKTVMLTTEQAPTRIAQAADPRITVIELSTPNVPRTSALLHTDRSVTSANLATVVQEFRDLFPGDDFAAVSNKLTGQIDSMTHAAARGSNDLIGRNVVSTIAWMSPDEYERLQALNAWARRRDLVGLRHVDELNQTLGRNLGYRYKDGAQHVILANLRLMRTLMSHPAHVLGHLRYGLSLVTSSEQRRSR